MCASYFAWSEEEVREIQVIIDEWNKMIFKTVSLSTELVRPSHIAAVSTSEGLRPMKWGFPPPGGKGALLINARSETAAEKPTFRAAYASRRCVISATGFIEYAEDSSQKSLFDGSAPKKKAVKKIPYLFTIPGEEKFGMAGLYSVYPAGGISVPHFTVMTAPANASVAPIHDRMPVILRGREAADWLEAKKLPAASPALAYKLSA